MSVLHPGLVMFYMVMGCRRSGQPSVWPSNVM
jgi:hypothetical protein